jgi:DNA-binding transcriptional LysR family regulator
MVQPVMRDFDWNDVRYFLAVVRARTLTLAARRLGTNHTTVARRIAALEAALNAKLFDRHVGGYVPTEQGERFLEEAEAMEASAILARSRIADSAATLSGAVRIGAPDGFGSFFLAPAIGALCDQHPELEIEIVAMPRVFSLSKREADLAISLSQPSQGRLVVRKLTDYELGLYAAPAYLRRAAPIRARADLPDHRFIHYIDDLLYTPQLDYVPQIDKAIRPRLRSANLVAQMRAAMAGAGLCVLPCFMADPEPGLVRVLADEVALTRSFWLAVHADQRNLARIRTTSQFIVDAVREARPLFLPAGTRTA